MDTNGGRARRLLGAELVPAVQAAIAGHPDVEFEPNNVGMLAGYCRGDFVGYIDMRALECDPPSARWDTCGHGACGGPE